MNHVAAQTTDSGVDADAGPALLDALAVIARHTAYIQAKGREGPSNVATDLIRADVDRALADAGLRRTIDDRGDEWAELDGRPVAWLGHLPARESSRVRP